MTNYQIDGFVPIPNSFCFVLPKAKFTALCNSLSFIKSSSQF